MRKFTLLLHSFIFLLLAQQSVVSQTLTLQKEWRITSGQIQAAATTSDKLIIGGAFLQAYAPAFFSVTDNTVGQVQNIMPQPTGIPALGESDGTGGWFVTGNFTSIGGELRSRIARFNADGTLHPWSPTHNGTGTLAISGLAVNGNILYVIGNFTTMNGITRNRLAAFDITTGSLTSFDPNITGSISTIAVYDNTLYISGSFTNVAGVARTNVAAFDLTNHTLTSWQPALSGGGAFVNYFARNGSDVYLYGDFSAVNGVARTTLAAVDANTGTATRTWAPVPVSGTNRYGMAFLGGNVYIAGSFTTMNGVSRPYLVAVDGTSGALTSWNPAQTGGSGPNVNSLKVNGGYIYVTGAFSSIGGATRAGVAQLDPVTGNATAWNPRMLSGGLSTAFYGSNVLITSNNWGANIESRSRLAALDLSTGAITTWNPTANNTVTALAVSGTTVYAGGQFTVIGETTRNRLAALDAATGALQSWDPNADGNITAIALHGGNVYVAGSFSSVGGASRSYIAAIDAATGLATAWNANANNVVNVMHVKDNILYVGGAFTSIGGQTRNRIAAFDLTTGDLTAWDPNADGTVNAIATDNNDNVFIGGTFANVSGSGRMRLASMNATTGALNSWAPSANNTITSIAVNGADVYVTGSFTDISGTARNRAAVLDAITAVVNTFNPNFNAQVNTVLINGTKVFFGGAFQFLNGSTNTRPYLTVFEGAAVLPVRLTSFSAAATANARVTCAWITAMEQNSKNFIIERSAAEGYFAPIGMVNAAGNSSTPVSYQFVDYNPIAGISHYRLKQVDLDGKSEYSVVKTVQIKTNANVRISQNPVAKRGASIQLIAAGNGQAEITITSLGGSMVWQKKNILVKGGENNIPLVTGHLKNGLYIVRVVNDKQSYSINMLVNQ